MPCSGTEPQIFTYRLLAKNSYPAGYMLVVSFLAPWMVVHVVLSVTFVWPGCLAEWPCPQLCALNFTSSEVGELGERVEKDGATFSLYMSRYVYATCSNIQNHSNAHETMSFFRLSWSPRASSVTSSQRDIPPRYVSLPLIRHTPTHWPHQETKLHSCIKHSPTHTSLRVTLWEFP